MTPSSKVILSKAVRGIVCLVREGVLRAQHIDWHRVGTENKFDFLVLWEHRFYMYNNSENVGNEEYKLGLGLREDT